MNVSAYRWEYITNLDFEWEIYTGQRHWRWSFVVGDAAWRDFEQFSGSIRRPVKTHKRSQSQRELGYNHVT